MMIHTLLVIQSTGAAEYTDCISAEREDPQNEYLPYDTKQSDGEASVMLELWECGVPYIAIAPRSTLVRSGSS